MSSARHIAITILHQCDSGRYTLDHWLDRAAPQIERLDRQDRALLHALVYGVLRWQARLDWMIDQLAVRPDKKIDPLVRVVLRLGLFQILFLDRIPPSAAVNTAVEWVKQNRRSWATGFVNSLLRRAVRNDNPITWPDVDKNPAKAIAVAHAFPTWLIRRWLERWGAEQTGRLCQSINTIAPITLRTNTLKTTRQKLSDAIQGMGHHIEITPYSPEGLRLVSPQTPIAQWPTFQNGDFQVQDEAAQLVTHMLAPQPGQRIWDACAGLGSKTAHIAQLMNNRGQILATDHRETKLAQLRAEMRRLSIDIVKTCCLDLAKDLHFPSAFDRILLDAPCSGLGVLQKNPDGKWRTQPTDLRKNAKRQLVFLEHAISHLAPDGILVYAVCSMEPEENHQIIDRFLQKHRDFGIYVARIDRVANAGNLLLTKGYLQTLPHHHQMDGFFAAALRRKHTNQP